LLDFSFFFINSIIIYSLTLINHSCCLRRFDARKHQSSYTKKFKSLFSWATSAIVPYLLHQTCPKDMQTFYLSLNQWLHLLEKGKTHFISLNHISLKTLSPSHHLWTFLFHTSPTQPPFLCPFILTQRWIGPRWGNCSVESVKDG